MARRDTIHKPVRNALKNDDWHITADPYRIVYEGTVLEADMRASRLITATRENRSIVIEVKSFIRQSFIHEFISACGQYRAYVTLLKARGQTENVYMAISHEVYQREFGKKAVEVLLADFDVRLLVVDIEKEMIVQWIE